jgi:branched-subunit amino acid aminotransferase/4-amino-4-deoxychorismate lyase
MKAKVHLNGKLVDLHKAAVSVSNPSLLHGVGLFETLRTYEGHPFRLAQHVARLRASALKLNMPIGEVVDQIPAAVQEVLRANQLRNARIRFTVSPPGPHQTALEPMLMVAGEETGGYPAELYEQGMTVYLCDEYRQSRQDPLAGHKTTSYFARLLALRNAQERGCGEALWFTPDNLLAEGSISNVFLVKNGRLVTPPLDTPVLPGVTRAALLELADQAGMPADQKPCSVSDLLDADEVFLANGIMEVMPVTRVEKKPLGGEKPGPVTRQLAASYRELVRRESETGSEHA